MIAGWHTGIVIDLTQRHGGRNPSVDASLAMIAAAAIMVMVGWAVEQFCRLPPDDPSAPDATGRDREENEGMPQEPVDPAGIEWRRVSPKYARVRVVGWAIGAAVTLAILSVPLVLRLTGVWPGLPGLAGAGACRLLPSRWKSSGCR